MAGNKLGNKRAKLNVEEIKGMILKTWKKAESLEAAKERAKIGKFEFFKTDESLNSMWKIFKKYPEVFLFDDSVDYVVEVYKAKHISISSDKFTQENNMREAVSMMRKVAKSIYEDLLQSNDASDENSIKEDKKEIQNNNINEKEDFKIGANLFDDKVKSYRFTPSIQEMFKDDETPIEQFMPSCGNKFITYLIKVKKILTLGDYIKSFSDVKVRNAIYQKSTTLPNEYNEFKNNVFAYIDVKMTTNVIPKKVNNSTKEANKANKIETINAIEDIRNFEAVRFEKDSKEMLKISKMVSDLLNKLTDEYIQAGLSAEEINVEIDSQIKLFRKIVDEKREELSKVKTASIIKARIAEGVKYKYKKPSTKHHSHNPFVSDDFNV